MSGHPTPTSVAQMCEPPPHEGTEHHTLVARNIIICDSPDGLADINLPDVELALWPRSLPLCLRNYLETLDASQLPDLRVLVHPGKLRQAVGRSGSSRANCASVSQK